MYILNNIVDLVYCIVYYMYMYCRLLYIKGLVAAGVAIWPLS